MPFELWEHRLPELRHTSDWVDVPIELDLRRAVTLVAMVAASLPVLSRAGDSDSTYSYAHELGLSWIVEDSLDHVDWHYVAGADTTRATSKGVARVSAPLATAARFRLYAPVLVAATRHETGKVKDRMSCARSGRLCGVNHEDLVMRDVKLQIGVRTI